jgi:hypothetical protein
MNLTLHTYRRHNDGLTARVSNRDQLPNPEAWEYVSSESFPYKHGEFCVAVAQALPGNWVAKPISDERADCNFYLVRDDGLKLFASAPGWSHKTNWQFSFAIGGNRYLRNRPKPITVNPARGATITAKSITNRLLQSAEGAHAEVIAQETAEAKAKDAQTNALSEINAHLGTNYDARFYHKDASVEVREGGRVSIQLHNISPELAKRVLALF